MRPGQPAAIPTVPDAGPRDRRVGAEGERDAGLEQAAQHEGPPGATGPEAVGDVAGVEGALRLHTRHDAQPREPDDVLVARQLGVFDTAELASRELLGSGQPFKSIKHEPIGLIADGVHGGTNTGGPGPLHPLKQLVDRNVEDAVRVLLAGQPGVFVDAVRGADVERAVGDELEGADLEE